MEQHLKTLELIKHMQMHETHSKKDMEKTLETKDNSWKNMYERESTETHRKHVGKPTMKYVNIRNIKTKIRKHKNEIQTEQNHSI